MLELFMKGSTLLSRLVRPFNLIYCDIFKMSTSHKIIFWHCVLVLCLFVLELS
jgi:hypothetical protein